MPFQVGQRWISDSESDQGLGTVTGVEHRFVNIVFTATGESRKYAKENAPLTRVIFNQGDLIPSHEGWLLKVESQSVAHGIISYEGIRQDTKEQVILKEVMIDHFIKFNKPHDRLLNSQVDRLDWFRLRKDCLQHQYQQQQSDLTGLTGGRVSLIPHQLYIADEVGNRFAPRVLLADEVGLGKTIEAGLIIHQQLVTGRAKRILIIVPESLMHQWLVEMLRRFNLNFSIFDNERCVETSQDNYVDGKKANPFSSEQLVLVNLGFITNNPEWYDALISEDWDLMVVDEAHHLNWQQDKPSIEYQCIEQLAQVIPGVLLLTATPDQLGHESHFARLRLLDADRFYDYQKFTEEESHYSEVADAANALVEGNKLSDEQETTLTDLLKESDISSQLIDLNQADLAISAKVRQELLKQLLDRHGTGRILFRNSRNTIKGFPARQVVPTALDMPEQYQENINEFMLSDCPENLAKSKQAKYIFTPEMLHGLDQSNDTWTDFDPRVDYLIELLQSLKKEKVLVICAHAQTAIDLEAALRIKEGIRAAVFHEGLSIFERDKAAAYFAQDEDSAQLLLCSEIGSEGRNFQFAHHLVLFDLPGNPDLLEQRIGRLDRIGQTEIIRIHVPYFADSAQQLLFDWYQQGMQAFEHTCITGRIIFESFGEQLLSLALTSQQQSAEAESLISDSWQKHLTIKAELESGRDKLLELNSSGQGRAHELVEKIQQADNDIGLPQFMFQALDVFGVQQDDKADNAIALNQSEHMLNSNFPCLPEDGTTVTFDRETALVNENYQLLTWDHPMVRGVMDLVLSDEIGNASIGLLKNEALPVGTFFLECLFTVEATAPAHLQLGRYLPTTPIRILVDKNGNNLADKVSEKVLDKQLSPVKKQMALQLIKALKSQIGPLVTKAEAHGAKSIVAIQQKSLAAMQIKLSSEQQRLTALKAINPSVRQEEIDFISQQQDELSHYIDKAQLTFEAIRMIVVTH
ncbi:RNA polymerase-associated protein RapA [Colwellia psychrerythraea]|uniref:RNA polymerase-associated protein RapA n=1 Tax=Colwellia psychrerythraea TaxID=28229 RepID=A0A099KQY1_COLPS|nr:RNA polymerase-associated protein RapA [Colwellia psychrerythraea]KGJ92317.1 RNA polymerase recycling, bacterial, C-terminal [Colwellia psychrerythraea]